MMPTSQITDAVNELFHHSRRAGARNVQIITDDRGFIYQDDGHGLRDRSDFEALIELEESERNRRVEVEHQPAGQGIQGLLAQDKVEAVNIASNMLYLTLDAGRWRTDEQYVAGWRNNLHLICFPTPGLNVGVTCAKVLAEQLVQALTSVAQTDHAAARSHDDVLHITLNGVALNA
jgi:hypothetical protein